jgi:hypothetical protein
MLNNRNFMKQLDCLIINRIEEQQIILNQLKYLLLRVKI